MKMRELKEKLAEAGYELSERMVKYYIELGILPSPAYPHPNQAVYGPVHLLRLIRISKTVSYTHLEARISSIIFKATTMGRSSSMSCMVR